jgi:uncharacterized small protein (TIGR04563 family)
VKRAGQKRSLGIPFWMSREVGAEAARLDRSLSWIVQQAWRLARAEILRAPPRTPTLARVHTAGIQDRPGQTSGHDQLPDSTTPPSVP